MRSPALILTLCLASVGAAGCAGDTTTTDSGTASNPSGATAHTARHHRHPPHHRRRRAPPSSKRLAVGRFDNHTVQPQPPAGSCHARGQGELTLPDPRCTPGAVSPAVTQANIQSTICRTGYTETVRPPESITEREKFASMDAYGDTASARGYEYDHLIALELGGATNDPRNLWPEPKASPKDTLENRLRALVCDGTVTLAGAQAQIAHNWVTAYRRYVGPTP